MHLITYILDVNYWHRTNGSRNKGSDLVLLKLNVLRVESDHVMSYGVTLKCFSSSCSAWLCSWSAWQVRKSSAIDPFWLQLGFPGGTVVKNLPANAGDAKDEPWVRKIPWSRKWQPTPVFLPGKFHGQRSLVGCSPWGRKELDTTEHTHKHTHSGFSLPWNHFIWARIGFY